MSYTDLIEKEGIESNYLVVLKPARVVDTWTLVSGNIYKNSFDYGHVIAVSVDGSLLTEGSSVTPSANEFYYDWMNEELYINVATPSTKFIAATYEMYFGTRSTHFYRIPTDNTTRQVYFDGTIIKPPVFKESLDESLYGFLPSQSSNIEIGNADHEWERHLYESSFKEKDIDVYHWLDDLDTDNIKLIKTATTENVRYNLERVLINLADRIDIFNKEFRLSGTSFYNTTTWPNLDPNSEGNPIRYIYGQISDMLFVNIDYDDTLPASTSDNRDWAVCSASGLNQISVAVSAAPASTTTRTYVDSTDGLNLDDNVLIDKAADEYVYIKAINRTGNEYIEHDTLAGAASGGDSVKRPTAANVFIEQDGAKYRALYDRDYTESVSNGVLQIIFTASMESNLGINTLTAGEMVYGRAYGKDNNVTLGGSPFGSDSTIYSCLTNPAVILFDIMKELGISESDINTSSFTSLSSSIGSQEVGISIPDSVGDSYPKYKDIIAKLMRTNLIRMFLDTDNKWEVSTITALGTEDTTIQEDEILMGSINYELDYKDIISEVTVSYRYQEASDRSEKEVQTSNTAKYLHGVSNQEEFDTYLLNDSDASTLATRLKDIFGDRFGTLEIRTKNRFFNKFIGDIIKVELDKLLGYEYIEGTLRYRKFDVLGINKGLRSVNIMLDDHKGIEDNSGDF